MELILRGNTGELQELRRLVTDGEIVVNVKDPNMAAIKATTEKHREIGRFSEQTFTRAIRDLVRIGADGKDPKRILAKLCQLFKKHGFRIDKEPYRVPAMLGGELHFAVLSTPVGFTTDGRSYQVELRARDENTVHMFENGAMNHERMIFQRLAPYVRLRGEQTLSDEMLLRVQARAMVYQRLFDIGGHTRREPGVMRVHLRVQQTRDYTVSLYEGSCVADTLACITDIGGFRFTVRGEHERRVELKHPLHDGEQLEVVIDRPNREGIALGAPQIRELLETVYSQDAQFQLAAALLEYERNGGRGRTPR